MRRGMAWVAALLGAGLGGGTVQAAVTVERTTYKGWQGAYRLSNGTVEVVVVPAVARVMRYGFVGGPNVLWENPAAAGRPAKAGDWPNIGGDKLWPWPQDDWPLRTGRSWPPPSASDQAAHHAEIVGGETLRLTSPLVSPYGIRMIRDIRLAATGTQVTLVNRFVKARDGADFPVAVWSITQMPLPDFSLIRLLPDSPLESGYKRFSPNPWKSIRPEGERVLVVERSPEKSAKLGADADLLAWVKGDLLFTQRIVGSPDGSGTYVAGDRAQIYSHPDNKDDLARGITPYVELELTSPRRTLAKREALTLTVVWDLRRLTEAQRPPNALATLLRGL